MQDRRYKLPYPADVIGVGSFEPGERTTPRDEAHAAAMDACGYFLVVPDLKPLETAQPTAEPVKAVAVEVEPVRPEPREPIKLESKPEPEKPSAFKKK